MGKIFYNNRIAKLLLFSGFHTIMLFGFILTKRKEFELSDRTINHELIHVAQYRECFGVGVALAACLVWFTWLALLLPVFLYYALYVGEWLISFVHYLFAARRKNASAANKQAYAASAMEMEAKQNECNLTYLKGRKRFAFVGYYGKI